MAARPITFSAQMKDCSCCLRGHPARTQSCRDRNNKQQAAGVLIADEKEGYIQSSLGNNFGGKSSAETERRKGAHCHSGHPADNQIGTRAAQSIGRIYICGTSLLVMFIAAAAGKEKKAARKKEKLLLFSQKCNERLDVKQTRRRRPQFPPSSAVCCGPSFLISHSTYEGFSAEPISDLKALLVPRNNAHFIVFSLFFVSAPCLR